MEGIMANEMESVRLNNYDHHHHQLPKQNDHLQDHTIDNNDQEGGKLNNGRKNEKTMLRTPADIYEHPSFYSFILDMPGLDAQNIKVKVENGILHVTGKRKKKQIGEPANANEGVKVIRVERRRARYMRKFTLSPDASHEDVKATYKDGVLSITVSKKLAVEKSKHNSLTNVSIS